MMAPDGKMRGPATVPSSMARLSPKAGPPTSRTVVNPRISVAVASAPATRLRWPMSPVSNCAGVGRTSIVCQWLSINPGISVRPPPSMSTVLALRSVGIGPVAIRSILFPRTRTLLGPESVPLLPSKIRTFWNRVIAPAAEGAAPDVCCAWPAWQSPSSSVASISDRYFPRFGWWLMRSSMAELAVGPTVLTFHPANADHVVGVPDFPSFDLCDLMLRILRPGLNRVEVPPVHRRNPGAIRIARPLDTKESVERLCVLNQPAVHLDMFGLVDRRVDGREDHCIVRRLWRRGNVRHQFLFS